MTTAPTAAARRLRLLPLAGVGAVLVAMVLPMLLIGQWTAGPQEAAPVEAAGATAALGAIFRASLRNLLRSALMTSVRAASRTVSRRVMRSVVRSMLSTLLPSFRPERSTAASRRQHTGVALVVAVVALAASFGGVLALSEPAVRADVSRGLPLALVALFGALPVLLHYSLMRIFAPLCGVTLEVRTTIDGLLLQAYFTGAASFLPMASDVELDGSDRDMARCAGLVQLGMLASFFLLHALAGLTGGPVLATLASLVLLYAFVFSFPLRPLDGGDVWAWSKTAWLALFGLTLWAFTSAMPEAFLVVL